MKHRLTALGLLIVALAVSPMSAAACAALFSPNVDVLQNGQAIVFTFDDSKQQVSAYVRVSYSGAAEDFAWIVPLPSNPQVDVAENELFTQLESLTSPVYQFPRKNCDTFRGFDGGAAGSAPPGSVDVYQQGQVGPYDFSVVGGENAGELSEWLRSNGYKVTEAMQPLIKLYTDEKMLFLAMKLQNDREAGDIQPVKMTFTAAKPMIPLRLAAVGAQPDTQVRVWLFADRPMAPENAERIEIPEQQVVLTSFNGSDNYDDLVRDRLAKVNGQGLVLEYAQPTSSLPTGADPTLDQLSGQYGYLTRYYTELSPEQMTFDPAFVPADIEDMSNIHDLTARISPYDCGAREVLSPADQLVDPASPQGFWIRTRWMTPWLAVPALLVVGLVAFVIVVRRRAR